MAYDLTTHAERVKTAIELDGAARSVIVASWRRCTYNYGLDPSANVPRRRVSAVELRESS